MVFYVYTNRLFYLVFGYLLFYSSFYRPLLFYAGSLALALSRVFPPFLFPFLSIFSYLVFFDVFNWVSSRTSSFPYSQSSSFLLILIFLVNPLLTPELAQDPAISLDPATRAGLDLASDVPRTRASLRASMNVLNSGLSSGRRESSFGVLKFGSVLDMPSSLEKATILTLGGNDVGSCVGEANSILGLGISNTTGKPPYRSIELNDVFNTDPLCRVGCTLLSKDTFYPSYRYRDDFPFLVYKSKAFLDLKALFIYTYDDDNGSNLYRHFKLGSPLDCYLYDSLGKPQHPYLPFSCHSKISNSTTEFVKNFSVQ